MARFVAVLIVVGVLLAVLAFVGISAEQAGQFVVQFIGGMVGLGAVVNKKDVFLTVYSRKEDGNCAIVICLLLVAVAVLFVVVLAGSTSGDGSIVTTLACSVFDKSKAPAPCN